MNDHTSTREARELPDTLTCYGDPDTLRDMAYAIADLLACGPKECADRSIGNTASAICFLRDLANKDA